MILNFVIPKPDGLLTQDMLKKICVQLDGKQGTLKFDNYEGNGIIFGEFVVEISDADADTLTNCRVVILDERPVDEFSEIAKLYTCVVVQQPKETIYIADLNPADKRVVMRQTSDMDANPDELVLFFFQKEENYTLDYQVVECPTDTSKTVLLFEYQFNDPDESDEELDPNSGIPKVQLN